MPSRPEVTIKAPIPLVIGTTTPIEIEVTAKEPTTVEYIEVHILGEQGWAVGSGKSRVSHDVTYPRLVGGVMGAGVLAAGTTRFTMQVPLPPDMSPSHDVSPAWARLVVMVRVSIPWWPDGKYRFVLPARLPGGAITRTPAIVRSTSAPDKPRLELGLASTRLIPGETVVGSCAVFHVDDDKPRDIDLVFVPSLTLRGRGGDRARRGRTFKTTITIPAGGGGSNVPFQLALPAWMTPSFRTASHELTWALVATNDALFGWNEVSTAIGLEIVDPSSTAAQLAVAPRLADERVASLFAGFARIHGWTVVDTAGELGAPVIEIELDDVTLRLAYAYRGEDGTFLVAQIAHPSLGLDLSVSASSAVRHLFWKDIEVDIAAWDRAHHVTARSAAQTRPVLVAVVPTLRANPELGALVRWDDDGMLFERATVGVQEADLGELASRLHRVAAAIVGAQQVIAAPPDVTIDRAAWLELARWLKGRLALGDLAIAGRIGEFPVELGLRWDAQGTPRTLHVQVAHPGGATAVRNVTMALARPAADILGEPLAGSLVELLTAWPDEIVDLRLGEGLAAASLVLGGAPIAVDASRVRELVERLRAVLVSLDPASGPYR